MKIILLDMDGVLLKPLAYHKALQETVRLVACALGFKNIHLTEQDISAFESVGVSSEWDSAAICAALLLERTWMVDKHRKLPVSLAEKPNNYPESAPPDFHAFAISMGQKDLSELRPLERAERLLVELSNHHNPDQKKVLQAILRDARAADNSLTHRTFQELVLGSQTYEEVYRLPGYLDTPSYLLEYDRPYLDIQTRKLLNEWLKRPRHEAVIFTSRPSTPLPGTFSTPEAELGAELVGLGNLPILGLGGLAWLSEQFDANRQAFLKPSPVHVLAALQLSLGCRLEDALMNAARLVEFGGFDESWEYLIGAHVWVYEDTTGGLKSALAAQSILGEHGIKLSISLFGIADDPAKVRTLQETGAETAPEINTALRRKLSPNN